MKARDAKRIAHSIAWRLVRDGLGADCVTAREAATAVDRQKILRSLELIAHQHQWDSGHTETELIEQLRTRLGA